MSNFSVIFFEESVGGACQKYRVWIPCIVLASKGIRVRYSQKWEPWMLSEFDLFVFQRCSVREAIDLIYSIRMQGKPVLYDLDDDLIHIPPSNPVYNLYLKEPKLGWYQLQSMVEASALTVTTEQLSRVYSGINKTYIIKNYIDIEDHLNIEPIRLRDDKVFLFWGGSNTHQECLAILQPVLSEVLAKHKEAVLLMMGDEAELGLPKDKVIFMPWGKYRFFQSVIRGCDIGLAPLAPNTFNLGKSDLRIQELACAKLPMVASNYGEYGESAIKAGGFVASASEDWIRILDQLITDPEERKRRGQWAWEWAQSMDIRSNIDKRIEVYEEVLDSAKPPVPFVVRPYTEAPLKFQCKTKEEV